jgi:predicted enzyme related to lactoylglutathione lyase
MADSENRALEIHEITFDARDPHALAAFWSALLERDIRPGDMPQDDSVLVVPAPGQPGLLFLRVPEWKTAKNRIHFDLWPTSATRDSQIKRAVGLGAVVLDDRRRADGTGWVVFADPEGNEFCIGRSAAERAGNPSAVSDPGDLSRHIGGGPASRRRTRPGSAPLHTPGIHIPA